MPWQVVHPTEIPKPVAPYSMGARTKQGLIFTAGIVSVDSEGKTIGVDDARTQTHTILKTIGTILSAASADFADVIQVQIFLKSFSDYASVNEIYRQYFAPPYPTRYCVQSNLVKPEWLVEIAVVAAKSP